MSDMEKPRDFSPEDPEKLADISRNTTYGQGETKVTRYKHADPNDGDEALKAFAGHEGETIILTPEAQRKLLRKIDLNLMPVGFPQQFDTVADFELADALCSLWP
jgi:ACS family allantoate permease-like MFS transporter